MKNNQPDFRDNHGCCRDFYCLAIFGGCIIAVFVIFLVGFRTGEPYKLYCPINSEDHYCGRKNADGTDLTSLPVLFRPNLTDSSLEICISECPTEGEPCVYGNGSITSEGVIECTANGGYYSPAPMISLMNRCFPNTLDQAENFESYKQLQNVFTTSVSDFMVSWWVFFVAAGCSFLFSFIWICVFQVCGICIVWTCILACLGSLVGIGAWCLYYGITQLELVELDNEKTNCYAFIVLGGILLFVFLVFGIIVIALRNQISLAVTLVSEASSALRSMCCLIIVPVGYIFFFVICVAMLIITMVYYFSSLDVTSQGGSREFQFTENTRYIVLFMVLMFFWVTFFLIGLNHSTIAGAGAEWYFSHDKEKDMPEYPIARSLKILLLHHTGSVAVGSFLIAVICTIRAIVLYFQKKVKDTQPMNTCLISLLACLQCWLACLQKIVEFLTSRAYIMMMIHGNSFFPSAINVVKLMLRNILRTVLLTGISKMIVLCGILGISLLSALVCLLILRPDFIGVEQYTLHVVYWWFVVALCFVIAFAITYLILQVYDFLIDTLFICFLLDEEVAQRQQAAGYVPFATPSLRKFMEDVKTEAELNKERKKRMQQVMAEFEEEANKGKGGSARIVPEKQNKSARHDADEDKSRKNDSAQVLAEYSAAK